jgi:lysophospholipase L1-like esterase
MVTLGIGRGQGREPLIAQDFGPALNTTLAWFDASDAATVTQSGGAVTQLNDKSGNTRHIGNTLTRRPTYDGANGKITFDGVNDSLYNSQPFLYEAGQYALYAVINMASSNYKCVLGEARGSSTAPGYCPFMTGTGILNDEITPYINNDAGSSLKANISTQASFAGTKKIVRITEKDGFITPWINGALAGNPLSYTRAGSTLTLDRFALGCRPEGTGDGNFIAAFELYEMIIAPDDSLGRQYEGYLAHKHGLTADLPVGHPYKAAQPLQGDVTDYTPALQTGPIRAALFGDSITAANSVNGSDAKTYRHSGYFTAYNALAKNRIYLPVVNNKGVGGDSTDVMVGRLSDITALTFDACFFMGGTNDISGGENFNTIRNEIDQILNHITITLGKTAIVLTILPRTHSADAVNRKQKLNDLNAFIMAAHGTREGRVISVNLYDSLDDGNDEPIVNATYDGLHPTPYGAMLMGQDISSRLAPYYGDGGAVDFSSGNLLANGTLSGTGGTGSGSIATGWTLSVSGPAVTATKDSSGYQKIETNYTSNAGDNRFDFTQTITSGYANGDTIQALALVEVENVANIDELQLEISLGPDAVQTHWRSYGMGQSGYAIAENYLESGEYLISTPPIALTSGSVTSITTRFHHQVKDSGVVTTSTVTIKGIKLLKL